MYLQTVVHPANYYLTLHLKYRVFAFEAYAPLDEGCKQKFKLDSISVLSAA